MLNKLILYHANCWDGFCAAWLLRKVFPDCEVVPVQYGQEPPDVTGRDVWIVDFSYKRDVLLGMKAKAVGILVIDHHKTAQAELDGLDWCLFDMNKSGARLTWELLWDNGFINGQFNAAIISRDFPPWLVRYTEDRDLWRWKLKDSREITTGLRSYPLDFEVWDDFDVNYGMWMESLFTDGKAIMRAEAIMIKNHVEHSHTIWLAGHCVPSVNATVLFSDIAGQLAEDAPFGVAWFVRDDGKVQFSLRSRKDGVDVSSIARKYGGGGHVAASGFELSLSDALNILGPHVEEAI